MILSPTHSARHRSIRERRAAVLAIAVAASVMSWGPAAGAHASSDTTVIAGQGLREAVGADAAIAPRAAADVAPQVTVTEINVDLPVVLRSVPSSPRAAEIEPGEPRTPIQEPVEGSTLTIEVRDGDLLLTEPIGTEDAQTLGITWERGDAAVSVRVRTDSEWSEWFELDADGAPDVGTPDDERAGTRAGTESLWIGDADAVQLSFSADSSAQDIQLALVGSPEIGLTSLSGVAPPPTAGPGASVPRSFQAVAVGQAPTVIPRAEWGAPAQVCTPSVAQALVGAALHHTAGSNGYSTVAQAMQQIRNDAAYHINARGWCDIGYNFVVDKWGNIYEGRARSLEEPVIGVHAGGFNTGTVGVAMLGTFDATPAAATLESVAQIIGWRLGQYGVDPRASMEYWTGQGENSRYRDQAVWLPRVFGHRDVGFTACPGNGGHAALPTIRSRAWQVSQTAWADPPTSLLRSNDNPTVYLVSGSLRHPIGSMSIVNALSALGPVLHVSGPYLNRWTDGPAVRRVLRSSNGTLWFFDANTRLAFTSCTQVAAFGLACGDAVSVTDAQLDRLVARGTMSQLYRTTNGKTFYVTDGTRREVADDASRALEGIADYSVLLTEDGIANLPYADPIARVGLLLIPRGGGGAGALRTEDGNLRAASALRLVPGLGDAAVELDPASLARVPTTGEFGALVKDGRDDAILLLTEAGKVLIADPATAGTTTPSLPAAVLDAIPSAASMATAFVRSPSRATVYLVRSGERRAIRSWADLVRLAGSETPDIRWVAQAVLDTVPLGEPYDAPGSLVRASSDATIYLVDGDDGRVAVPSFRLAAELGAIGFHVVSDSALARRTSNSELLGVRVRCGSSMYFGANGALHAIRPAEVTHFAGATTTLDPTTCAGLPQSSRPMERFLRVANGTIFMVTGGVKQPIRSYARYLSLGGTAQNTLHVSDFIVTQFPTGSLL